MAALEILSWEERHRRRRRRERLNDIAFGLVCLIIVTLFVAAFIQ